MTTPLVKDLSDCSASEVLEQLFRDHSGMVYRTAYGVTGNREDAQDILQTIFLRLLRRELSQDFRQTPKTYFYRAAVNLSLDTLKARRRRSFITDVSCAELPAPTSEPDQHDHARLYEAVAALGPTNGEIIILRYVHDYTDAQIAQMLGKSRTAVAVSLFRSRARLKKLMRDAQKEDL